MKRKIAFACNWGNDSAELLIFLARQTPGGVGVWGELQGIDSPGDADYLVVLEDLPPSLKRSGLDLERTIFLPREPTVVRPRKNYEYFAAPLAFTHHDIHQAAVWRIMRPFEELVSAEYPAKSRSLSSVTSAANETPSHGMRVQFLLDFARRHPGLLDVYGYGWKDELGTAFKGEVGNRFAKITEYESLCKLSGLQDYRYSLAFENCRQRNYFSEKALDCWLAWSMPIYWGCPNLADYFPQGSYHEIDPSRSDCVDRVAEIVSRPIGEKEIAAMREARDRILYRYNIWSTVEEIISGRRPNHPLPRSFLRRIAALLRSST